MGLPSYISKIEFAWNGTSMHEYQNKDNVIKEVKKVAELKVTSLGTIPGMKETISWAKESNKYDSSNEYVPQGICVAGNFVIITAYDHSSIKRQSVLYVLDEATKEYLTTIILPFTSHVGGTTFDEKNECIWVSNGSKVAGFPLVDLISIVAEHKADAEKKYGAYQITSMPYSMPTLTTASYLSFFDGLVWAGSFDEEKVSDIYGYDIDVKAGTIKAKYYMEAPVKVQGMTFYKKGSTVYFAVSKSYGNHPSEMRLYKPNYDSPKKVDGQEYTKIIKNDAYRVLTYPCRSEEMHTFGNQIYTIFESCAAEYRGRSSIIIDKFVSVNADEFFGI